ncbi:HupE/UreJ family protein [Tumebacillus permanentifrigoris]|uniref:Hydrogenase/urease accessory protein HupE n=1 Tax=Tumebacillus permanentifrigoris TaxID=378543 RepID=A0A316DCK5_9BACL|nr:HupE/UreJ family protein [Tumebacillus permanentifrigoris]PWK13963.1 hydrogenase/urease accessory protein HupE [Tumebacillus permanentifrigoris]
MRFKFVSAMLSIFFLCSLLLVSPASAHQQSLASSKITFENKKMHISLLIDQKSILEINGYDIEKTQSLDESQLSGQIKDKSFDYLKNGFHVKNNGQEMAVELESVSVPDLANVQFDLVYSSGELIDKIDFDYNIFFENSDGKHKNVATIENGDTIDEFVFTNSTRHLAMEAGVELSFWNTLGQFVVMGIQHILTGYDHLAFLLALIILGGSFTNILKIVTSFTVAHSITLILAALEFVSLPGRLIESAIAITILYVALENQFIKNANYRWMLTGVFGLVHGFGFAGALAETQVPKNHFIEALLTFNVGVEIGQLAVVLVLLPIILYVRRFSWNIWFVRGISGGVALFGLIWFVQRAFELNILPFLAV